MPTRERAVDRATLRARQLIGTIGDELRRARRNGGLSVATVATAAGVSTSQLSRVERGLVLRVSVATLARVSAVLGLELSLRAFPVGDALRDAGQIGVVESLRAIVHPSLAWGTEVPMPNARDLRAWDATVGGDGWLYGIDAETAPRDAQAIARRMQLKSRDSGVDGMILLLKDSRQSRIFLEGAAAYLGSTFPVPGTHALRALREGRDPGGSAIVLLRRPHRRSDGRASALRPAAE